MTAAMGATTVAQSSVVGAAHPTVVAQGAAVTAVRAGHGLMGILVGTKAAVVAAFAITRAALEAPVVLVVMPVAPEALAHGKAATGAGRAALVAPAGLEALVVQGGAALAAGRAALAAREAQAGQISGAAVVVMAMRCRRATATASFKAWALAQAGNVAAAAVAVAARAAA